MEIFENYNNASQKYGKDIVQLMANQGISDKYLLSACRFYVEDKVPCDVRAYKVKQWNQYVVPFQSTDINKLQFDDFNQILLQALRKASMPNKFFDNGTIEIGEFKTYYCCPVKLSRIDKFRAGTYMKYQPFWLSLLLPQNKRS